MTTEILNQLTHITNKIKEIYGEDYSNQYCNVALNLINEHAQNLNNYQILIEATYLLIDDDYKHKLIQNLNKKIKEQDCRINNLEKEVKDLKQDNKILKEDNINLNKKVNILMKNHYNLVLWQAYKNLEYYIIKKVTNFDDTTMETLNTNLNEFIKNPDNNKYIEEINKLIDKFKIDKYKNNLGKLTKNRLKEAHPKPIELDELELACAEMKSVYSGIEELYNNYQEVYNYFN